MNPARSFGPAVAFSIFGTGNEHWEMHHIYWIGPLAGAAIAAGLYRFPIRLSVSLTSTTDLAGSSLPTTTNASASSRHVPASAALHNPS